MQPILKPAPVSLHVAAGLVHCRRTAAVARLIAHHLFLLPEEKDLLDAACFLHHGSIGVGAPKRLERLLADIFPTDEPALLARAPISVGTRGVLNAYAVPGSGAALELRLGGILRLADAFDQNMEAQPIDGEEVGEILERLRGGVEAGLWPEEAIDALVQSTLPPPIVGQPGSWRVPVFPEAAVRTLHLMRDPRAGIADVVKAASLDPALAGLVMRLANSALFGQRAPVSTLSKAIGRLGFATSQKVIISAALRAVFDPPKLRQVWRHSLEVADLSEQLAGRAGAVDPAEAYLVGLLHDVGQIALLSMVLYDSARLEGLVRAGCSPVYAEDLLLRTNHAALGARIATAWKLPESMVGAIRQHHRPEKEGSALACLLYLAEQLSGSDEDLPSIVRLDVSLKGVGLVWGDIANCTISALGNWLAAA